MFPLVEFYTRSPNDTLFEELPINRVLRILPPIGFNGPWLAGGAVRRTIASDTTLSDFDFFFSSQSQLEGFKEIIEQDKHELVRETEHNIHYKIPYLDDDTIDVQLIKFKYYEDKHAVIDSFDFTICQFLFDGTYVTHGKFSMWDLAKKRLAIHKVTYPVSTIRRMIKYSRQGFTVCDGAIAKVLMETALDSELRKNLDIEYID